MQKMKCCKYCQADHIHNTSFYLQLTNGPHKLDCYITQDQKRLTVTNTLAYLAHFSAWKKLKGCEYNHLDHIHNTSFYLQLTNGPNKLSYIVTLHKTRKGWQDKHSNLFGLFLGLKEIEGVWIQSFRPYSQHFIFFATNEWAQ
jgi:hypothetical protein